MFNSGSGKLGKIGQIFFLVAKNLSKYIVFFEPSNRPFLYFDLAIICLACLACLAAPNH